MFLLQLSRLRVFQLGVLSASMTSTGLQFLLPIEVAVPLNVLLLGLVFGAVYTHSEKKAYTTFMLGLMVALNCISLFGLLQHGLEVYSPAYLTHFSALYLLPFASGIFAPIMVFFALYEVQDVARRSYRPARNQAGRGLQQTPPVR